MQSKKTNRVDRYLRKGFYALGWAAGAFVAGVAGYSAMILAVVFRWAGIREAVNEVMTE